MVALLLSILTTLKFLAKKMLNGRGSFGGNVFKNPACLYEANWKKVLSWPQLCTAFDAVKCMPHEQGVRQFTYG